MAVKIRLTRIGKKRQPYYRVVVTDSRNSRDGRYIEQLGQYDPRQEPSLVQIDADRAAYWLSNGAQPSPQARKLLEIAGALAARTGRAPRPAKVHVVGEAAQRAAAAEAATEAIEASTGTATEDAAEETETAAEETPGETA